MASFVFDSVKDKVANGTINFVANNTFKVALVSEDFFDDSNISAKTKWSDVSNYEITDSSNNNNNIGYSQQYLDGVNTTTEIVGSYTNTIIKADDINYGNTSTITARGAVIFRTDTDETLILAIDFGADVMSTNGVFTLKFSETGFLKIR